MGEYIDRVDAIKAVNEQNAFTMTRAALLDVLNSIPAAGVAPVVHCWECEHSYEAVGGRFCTYGVCVDCEVPDDFYCGNGKRGETGEG